MPEPAHRSIVLRAVAPFAIAVALGSILGRAAAPSLVGSVRWGDQLLWVDGMLAQLLAMLSTVLLGGLLVLTSIAERPVALRVPLVVLGGVCLLVALSAAGVARVPPFALGVVAATSAATALLVAATGRRAPELILGLCGLAALARLAAVQLSFGGSAVAAGVVATGGAVIELGALGVAASFLLRGGARGAIGLAAAAVVALAAAWIAWAAPEGEGLVLLRHGIERLAPRPHPLGALPLAPALSALGASLAVALLVARRADRAIVGAASLALLVRGQADVPLLGIALAASAHALFLVRSEGTGLGAPRLASERPSG